MKKFGVFLAVVLFVASVFCIGYRQRGEVFTSEQEETVPSDLPSLEDTVTEQDIRNNIEAIMKCIANGDAKGLAKLTTYPLKRDYPLKDIENEEQMIAYFDVLFDDSVKEVMRNASVSDWHEYGWRGYLFKDGMLRTSPEWLYAVYYDTAKEKSLYDMLVKREKESLHPSLQTGEWRPWGCYKTQDGLVLRIDGNKSQYRLSLYRKGTALSGKPDVCLTGTVEVEGTILNHIYTFKGKHETYEINDINVVYNVGDVPTLTIYKGKSEEREYNLTPCYWLDLVRDSNRSVPLVYGGMKGLKNSFYMKQSEEALWQLWYGDKRIRLGNLMDDGVPEMDAFASPDGKHVYVIGNIMANGNSMNSFFVYRVDAQTLRTEFVASGADATRTEDGFKVVAARCINPDAKSNALKRFTVHDVFYGFDGKIKKEGKETLK